MMHKFQDKIQFEPMKPLNELQSLSRLAAEEGVLLLHNQNNLLPLNNVNVAVFGRIQFDYYKSGTGSGGLVNVEYVPSIIEILKSTSKLHVDEHVYNTYKQWIEHNPFDAGKGSWATEPWMQQEMPLDLEVIKAASMRNDVGIVIIGRTAGEDKDNSPVKGSYYLTDIEEALLENVSKYFKKTLVILNTGNLIDLSFIDRLKIDGLVFAWHGGEHGALALVDVLLGYSSPSAKLPISIAYNIEDYPSYRNFGQKGEVVYEEDIYVGYRYFETFAKDRVRYPFGFGLSYTTFDIKPLSFKVYKDHIYFEVLVRNTGSYFGKEVVQVYLEKPQGKLGQPLRELVAFNKTGNLNPGEQQVLKLEIDLKKYASFDDSGRIFKHAYILEEGAYKFYLGNSIRESIFVGDVELKETKIVSKSQEINAPTHEFLRIKPNLNLEVMYEKVPTRETNYNENIRNDLLERFETNSLALNLMDVYNNKLDLKTFIGSLSIDELIYLTRGEGMSSPKVTSGTAAAFGGVTDELIEKGIAIACAADGPSGIRMDSGYYATSLPIGTALASSFNLELIESLYEFLGYELRAYNIDMVLAPGMNIMRNPLNGRNFEYFSEDPLLTGLMASSVTNGLHYAGLSGTLKHLYGNNQETDRTNVNAIISGRAQREIYLKPFEIAIKSSKAKAIMTSYNPVNGIWSASNFEVNKKLLRDEWNFQGIVVTDWWAKMNDFGFPASLNNTKAMIVSQNDVYMVVSNAKENSANDNAKSSYLNQELKLEHLQHVAKNILNFIMYTPAFSKLHQIDFIKEVRPFDPWVKINKLGVVKPTLNRLKINGNDVLLKPYVSYYHLKEIDEIYSIEVDRGMIDLSFDKTYARIYITSGKEHQTYHIRVGKLSKNTSEFVDLCKLEEMKLIQVGAKVWTPIVLELESYLEKSSNLVLENKQLNVMDQNQHISYALEFMENGKYIIDFSISSSELGTAQLPFSVYVDNKHETTLTIPGTGNNTIVSRALVIIKKGKHSLTFKFNKSSITVSKILVERHG
jgi:beta-glucosidase